MAWLRLRFVLSFALLFLYIHRSLEPIPAVSEAPPDLVIIECAPFRLFVKCSDVIVLVWRTNSHLRSRYARYDWLRWLLLFSGDSNSPEVNPGPVYKYPCTVCAKPVMKNQQGIGCDRCERWTHAVASTPVNTNNWLPKASHVCGSAHHA